MRTTDHGTQTAAPSPSDPDLADFAAELGLGSAAAGGGGGDHQVGDPIQPGPRKVPSPAGADMPAAEILPPALIDEAVPARRTPGRPLGSGNRSLVTEKRIKQHNNARTFLDNVVRGGMIKAATKTGNRIREWCFPTVQERIRAAEIQLRDAGAVLASQAAEAGVAMGPMAIVNISINGRQP
jgi:hypothetical protein